MIIDRYLIQKFELFRLLVNSVKMQLGLTIAISLLTVIITSLIPYLIIILLLGYLFLVFGEKLILYAFPLILLTLITDIAAGYRDMLVLLLGISMLSNFLKKYNLNFSIYPKLPRQIITLFLIFIFTMVVSTLASLQPTVGIQQIIRVIAFLILFYLLTSFIDTFSKLNLVLYGIISAGLVLSFSLLYEFGELGFSAFLSNDVVSRLGGFFSNANFTSVPIFVATILSFSYFLYYRTKVRYLFLISSIITLFALLLNNSRSAILALLLAAGTFLFVHNRKLFFKMIFVLSTIFLILMIWGTGFRDFLELYFRIERLGSGRENWWQMAYDTFSNNPTFGVGPAVFKYQMYKYLPVQLGSWEEQIIQKLFTITDYGTQHNLFLFVASDLGIFGILSVIALFGIFIFSGFNSIQIARRNALKAVTLNIAFYAIGLGFFIRSFFESINIFSYGWISADLPFWLIFYSIMKVNEFQSPSNSADSTSKD